MYKRKLQDETDFGLFVADMERRQISGVFPPAYYPAIVVYNADLMMHKTANLGTGAGSREIDMDYVYPENFSKEATHIPPNRVISTNVVLLSGRRMIHQDLLYYFGQSCKVSFDAYGHVVLDVTAPHSVSLAALDAFLSGYSPASSNITSYHG